MHLLMLFWCSYHLSYENVATFVKTTQSNRGRYFLVFISNVPFLNFLRNSAISAVFFCFFFFYVTISK